MISCDIPIKLPSANEYINACRQDKHAGAKMKKDFENQIALFVKPLPKFDKPITIHFHWIEGNKRRDLDNISFAKKFILDTLVKLGKLKDDNRKCVTGFKDTFSYGDKHCVILRIEEVDDECFNSL